VEFGQVTDLSLARRGALGRRALARRRAAAGRPRVADRLPVAGRDAVATYRPPAAGRVSDRLDSQMRAFIGRQAMVFVTTDAGERLYRSGPPGFVRAIGESRLVWPDDALADLGPCRVRLLFVSLLGETGAVEVCGWLSPGRPLVQVRVEQVVFRGPGDPLF
jgi:hypothetical protein